MAFSVSITVKVTASSASSPLRSATNNVADEGVPSVTEMGPFVTVVPSTDWLCTNLPRSLEIVTLLATIAALVSSGFLYRKLSRKMLC